MSYQPDFARLAENYIDTVYRVALCCLRSPHDADDATQNVMLRLLRYAPKLESEEHARRWLIRASVNESHRLASSIWRTRTADIGDYAELLQAETAEESGVAEAVMSLPEKYRVVVHLHYFEGYRAAELAAMLGISVSAATTRLQRAREALKKRLD